jgi:hypothetical protein
MSCELKELLTHLVESFQVLLSKMGVCHSFYRDWARGLEKMRLESLKDAAYGMCIVCSPRSFQRLVQWKVGPPHPTDARLKASLVTSHFTFLTIHSTNTLCLYIIWRFT